MKQESCTKLIREILQEDNLNIARKLRVDRHVTIFPSKLPNAVLNKE